MHAGTLLELGITWFCKMHNTTHIERAIITIIIMHELSIFSVDGSFKVAHFIFSYDSI